MFPCLQDSLYKVRLYTPYHTRFAAGRQPRRMGVLCSPLRHLTSAPAALRGREDEMSGRRRLGACTPSRLLPLISSGEPPQVAMCAKTDALPVSVPGGVRGRIVL